MHDDADRDVTGAPSTVPSPPPPPPPSSSPPPPGSGVTGWWVPWTLGDVLAAGALVYLLVAPVVATLVRRLLPAEQADAVAFPAIMFAAALTVVGWVALRHRGRLGLLFGRAPAGVRDALAGVGHGLVAFFGLNLALGLLFTWLTDALGVEVAPVQERIRELAADPEFLPFLLLSVVVAAPLAEELFFRGLLFQFVRDRTGTWVAVVVSGLVFGLVHWETGNIVGTVYMVASLSVVGMYLAWVFHRRESLAAPITMHATFNLLAAAWILQGPT